MSTSSHKPFQIEAQSIVFWVKEAWVFLFLCIVGGITAYIDSQLKLDTMLVEGIHVLVLIIILVIFKQYERKYPEIKQFGWSSVTWGIIFLLIGSIVDIADDPPMVAYLASINFNYGRSWQQAFIKKILGYTVGIGLMAFGFSQWIPWMVKTRQNVESLNLKLSQANKNMNQLLRSLDDHVEAERLNISRELHDDVAQQLTSINFQLQLCEKTLIKSPEAAQEQLKQLRDNTSEALKSIRQISQGLRPESLYALGFVNALAQFCEKRRSQYPDTQISFNANASEDSRSLDELLDDRNRLHLFRALQEGINNSLKHSNASEIVLTLTETEKHITLILSDNGKGLPWTIIPTDEELVQNGHLGLVGLKERIKELNGEFKLYPNPSGGTIMEIHIPK